MLKLIHDRQTGAADMLVLNKDLKEQIQFLFGSIVFMLGFLHVSVTVELSEVKQVFSLHAEKQQFPAWTRFSSSVSSECAAQIRKEV